MELGEIITAMVTPFDNNGQIDYTATEQLLEHLIANGTDAVVVAGTTGESPTLSLEEKRSLFQFVVEKVANRIPVIAGTGSNNTQESIELTKQATAYGIDGVMLVTPYYNRPSQTGLYEHFKQVAIATHLPVMLYNVPGRTACHLEVETIIELSKINNIVSLKDASANLEAISQIIAQTADDFKVYSGDDALTLPILSVGGAGVVSVSAHVIGNEMKQMVRAFQTGDIQLAAHLHGELLPTFQTVFSAPSPTPLKAMLNLAGVSVGTVRLPLVPLSDKDMQRIKQHYIENVKK